MIPRLPYLQNAVAGFHRLRDGSNHDDLRTTDYVEWMRNQGVIMPIKMEGDIDSVRLEFTDPKSEFMFMLRWS